MSVATSTALGIAGVVGAGASLGAGIMQSNAAKDATKQANKTQMDMYNNNVALEAPYRNAGQSALSTIGSDLQNGTGFAKPFNMNDFYNSPGYQFQLDQGNQAIQRSAAARGGLLSGGAMKALDQYTTGLANQTYNQAFNNYLNQSAQQYGQLYNLASLGQNATAQTANGGINAANNISNNTMQGITGAANANASGLVGASNALNNSLSNYYLYNGLNKSGYANNNGNPYLNLQQAQQLASGGGPANYFGSNIDTLLTP